MEHKMYTTGVALMTFSIVMTAFYWKDWKQSQYVDSPRPQIFRKLAARKVERIIHRMNNTLPQEASSPVPPVDKNLDGTVSGQKLLRNDTEISHTTSSLHQKDDAALDQPLNCVKQIQLWSKFTFDFPQEDYECPNVNCKARYIHSTSYQRLATSHAVILHHKGTWSWDDLARNRPNGQLWIYMTKESPIHSKRLASSNPSQVYNWSMTYHTGSDVTIPYGRYFENPPEISQSDDRNWATGKSRLVAWMASNCGTTSWGRTKFVKQLQTYIQVDTYGACGKLRCPRRSEDCDRILSAHKFYLSLENSECDDYITEKFWKNGLSLNMVPIVYGTTRDRYERVAPSHSFIHVSDFKNMTALVDYIKYLDKNDTAYNEYFEWKKKGSVEYYNQCQAHCAEDMFCGIVKKLKEMDDQILAGKTIEPEILDIKNWWRASCHHRKTVWSP